MSQPISVTPQEIHRVLNLLSVAGSAELATSGIAKVIGPPVTVEIVRKLMGTSPGLFAQHPEAVRSLIMNAKREGAKER